MTEGVEPRLGVREAAAPFKTLHLKTRMAFGRCLIRHAVEQTEPLVTFIFYVRLCICSLLARVVLRLLQKSMHCFRPRGALTRGHFPVFKCASQGDFGTFLARLVRICVLCDVDWQFGRRYQTLRYRNGSLLLSL
jgi:hypothetical protein